MYAAKTILLVEDDLAIGGFLVEALQLETPYQASLATDGIQALKRVKTLMPDLFVLDYGLPQMNGLELYDRLQATETFTRIPTLFMSAYVPRREIEQRGLALLEKPFELEDFLTVIDKLLAETPS